MAQGRTNPLLRFAAAPVAGLIGAWIADDATTQVLPNSVAGAGAFTQDASADRPSLIFANGAGGVRALRFDGSSDDLKVTDGPILRPSPQLYFAAAAERFMIDFISNTRFQVRIAITSSSFAQRNYNFTNAAFLAGIWLEMLYDGSQGTEADRLVFAVDGTPLAVSGSSGTLPTTLQAGDATEVWLSSQNGSANGQFDFSRVYLGSSIPSGADRTTLRNHRTAPTWA